jgi:mono/diheme cytochrome c family protein
MIMAQTLPLKPRLPMLALSLCALSVLAGCALWSFMPSPAEGQRLYAQNCVQCHGASGLGDGDLAQGMAPRPANLTQIAAQNGGAFPRTRVLSAIDGYAKGTRGGAMPEFGAWLGGPTVPVALEDGSQTPVPRPLAALLGYLESIQTPG